MVGTRGFEPPTSCTPCKRSTRLNYVPKIKLTTIITSGCKKSATSKLAILTRFGSFAKICCQVLRLLANPTKFRLSSENDNQMSFSFLKPHANAFARLNFCPEMQCYIYHNIFIMQQIFAETFIIIKKAVICWPLKTNPKTDSILFFHNCMSVNFGSVFIFVNLTQNYNLVSFCDGVSTPCFRFDFHNYSAGRIS